MYRPRRIDLVAAGAIALPTLAALAVWPRLPETLAIHWQGRTPDNYATKSVAVFGTALFGVAAIAFVRLAPPWATSTPGGDDIAVLGTGITIAWVQAIVVVWNLGYRFDVMLATLPLLAAVGLLILAGLRGWR
ncbi:MAG: DUF1648 domain-containing protein [Haloplanus sp.]